MKKITKYILILCVFVWNIPVLQAQTVADSLTLNNTNLLRIRKTIASGTYAYDSGFYNIGREHTASDTYVYRSLIELNGDTFQPIISLGYNVTITKVTVLYRNTNYANTGSYTFNIAGFGPRSKDAQSDWNAIKDDSVSINGNSLSYGTGSFVGSNSLKTVIQNWLDSGDYSTSIILGAFSNDEDKDQSYAQIDYIHLKIVYQRPASTISAIARNDYHGSDGGNIGVGVDVNPTAYSI